MPGMMRGKKMMRGGTAKASPKKKMMRGGMAKTGPQKMMRGGAVKGKKK